jgi:hypothetical protein
MSNVISPMPPAGAGIMPNNHQFRVRNVGPQTLTAGMIAQIDLGITDSDTASIIPGHNSTAGSPDSVWACVVGSNPTAHTSRYGQFVVILETITAGSTGLACATGVVTAQFLGDGIATRASSGSLVPMCVFSTTVVNSSGMFLVPATVNSTASGTAAGIYGQKIVGYLLGQSAHSASDSSNTGNVWFCGFGAGFGQNAL